MSDIIQLLPDAVANQIAAGEVVQRPASVVKELLENSVDAKATHIQLIIKDAGKTLIQVIDSGIGMSPTDARLSFERHATSKIRKADDLFAICSMGFRGEALASIAAIASVELKTRRESDSVGTHIIMEGSEVKKQEAVASPVGTNFSVKNLFYNVPARRNFLKSDTVEFRHIVDEFQRVVLAHPEIHFTLNNNGSEMYNLPAAPLKQRIMGLMGNSYNAKLVPVDEDTPVVKITGFAGTPEASRKTRGEQFFFVNNRFIKSQYLHHAAQSAYKDMIASDQFASYFIFLEVQPSFIDVNIHPTKTEIKFEDERTIYSILHSGVKRALGKYNIVPSIDFNTEASIHNMPLKPVDGIIKAPEIKVNPNYNPFKSEKENKHSAASFLSSRNKQDWQKLYEDHVTNDPEPVQQQTVASRMNMEEEEQHQKPIQIQGKYIISHIRSGLLIIDQQRAQERIIYEQFAKTIEKHRYAVQQLLFPETMELSMADSLLLKEIMAEINMLGFDVSEFGQNTFVIHGVPADVEGKQPQLLLEQVLDHYKQSDQRSGLQAREKLTRSMAKVSGIKAGKILSETEMRSIIDRLFACEQSMLTPSGEKIVITIPMDELDKKFDQ